jgi:hypothetical protein
MSTKRKYSEIIQSSIDVDLMDTVNVANLITNYADEQVFMYHTFNDNFYAIYHRTKLLGYIPTQDQELLDRVRDLVNIFGWNNTDRSIRLDMSSWRLQSKVLRHKIMSL